MTNTLKTLALVLLLALPPATVRAQGELALLEQEAFRAAVEVAAPSVVQLNVIGGSDRVEGESLAEGPATGVILSADGYVVTSLYRFTPPPAAVVAKLSDGRQFAARLVASDHNRKLALLALAEAEDLPVAKVAPYDPVKPGQWAIAIGRAFRPDRPHVGVGIVSAKRRLYGRALQTDAPVSAANYGGPLVDLEGRVIGILSPLSPASESVIAGTEWYDSGIGFAIPLETWLPIAERLKEGKDLERGILGISFVPGMEHLSPPKVSNVAKGGPAEQAGLKAGDVIESIDGEPIESLKDVKFAVLPHYAGDTLTIAYRRGKKQETASMTLVSPKSLVAEEKEPDQQGPVGGIR